jgi:hypothetical protein
MKSPENNKNVTNKILLNKIKFFISMKNLKSQIL